MWLLWLCLPLAVAEAVILKNLRRSAVWDASIWGTEGREFESPQPDTRNTLFDILQADSGRLQP